MAFELIPFPLSVLFVVVFCVAAELVLWKLRKYGKVYRMLSNLGVIVGLVVVGLVLALVVSALL
jgi:DNA-binding transcriptional regulator of glucitol operon